MEKYSVSNAIFVFFVKIYHTLFWYKSVVSKGLENFEEDKPIILTPNHQNAVMDPIAVIFTLRRQTVYLARADVFANKTVAKMLRFLRIMPIYRMRDGAQSLGKNEKTFKDSASILAHNKSLSLFPEAQHWGFRKLRALKKGVPRIAFLTEQMYDFKLGTAIVPIGMYYDEYQPFRKNVFVNYGKPIPVADYKDAFLENENKGFMELRKAMTVAMKELMLHIETDTYYEDVNDLRTIVQYESIKKVADKNEKPIVQMYEADRYSCAIMDKMIEENEEGFLSLKSKADEYKALIKKFKLTHWFMPRKGYSLLAQIALLIPAIVLFPAFLVGFLSHIAVKTFLDQFVKAKIKDPQFVRSLKFALGYFLLPLNYWLFLGIVALFIDQPWYIWIGAIISMPVFGVIAHNYGQVALKWWQSFRYTFAVKASDKKKAELLYQDIVATVLK